MFNMNGVESIAPFSRELGKEARLQSEIRVELWNKNKINTHGRLKPSTRERWKIHPLVVVIIRGAKLYFQCSVT